MIEVRFLVHGITSQDVDGTTWHSISLEVSGANIDDDVAQLSGNLTVRTTSPKAKAVVVGGEYTGTLSRT